MIIEIQHETCLAYSEPVTELLAEFRMEPMSDEHQSCRSFNFTVNPSSEVFRYQDGFGNRVHHFNVLAPSRQLRAVAASIVETHPGSCGLVDSKCRWPLEPDALDVAGLGFLALHGPVRSTPLLVPLLERLRPAAGQPIGEYVFEVAEHIASNFTYARDVTLASSPIDDLLVHGKGVCQDFTHLMIAVLRSYNLPARYVSGYIHRLNKDSQSHAWCEVWLPEVGWCGIDPTNRTAVNDHFVKVAVGRDFTDVSPNKGVYHGRAEEEIFVRVETRGLSRLPSISWQDAIPPFEVPLTAVSGRARGYVDFGVHAHQQQQQ